MYKYRFLHFRPYRYISDRSVEHISKELPNNYNKLKSITIAPVKNYSKSQFSDT
jgi:hypothetical protein